MRTVRIPVLLALTVVLLGESAYGQTRATRAQIARLQYEARLRQQVYHQRLAQAQLQAELQRLAWLQALASMRQAANGGFAPSTLVDGRVPGVPVSTGSIPGAAGPGAFVAGRGVATDVSSSRVVPSFEPPRRTTADHRSEVRDATRERALERPDLVLQGLNGRPNDLVLNDLLAVLRSLPEDELRAALDRDRGTNVLGPDDRRHVRLSPLGSGTSFRLGDREGLVPRWPRALRSAEFSAARDDYEQAGDSVRAFGELTHEDERRLHTAVARLRSEFQLAFDKARRTRTVEDHRDYKEAERMLVALEQRVHDLEFDDPRILHGRDPFAARTMGELVEYAVAEDLRFAPPDRTAEGTYGRVYLALREMVESSRADTEFAGRPDLPMAPVATTRP